MEAMKPIHTATCLDALMIRLDDKMSSVEPHKTGKSIEALRHGIGEFTRPQKNDRR